MKRGLSLQQAKKIAFSLNISDLKFEQILQNVDEDVLLKNAAPDGVCQIDPRQGTLVIYNPARSRRLHAISEKSGGTDNTPCPICEGATSNILDLAEHSEGFTFINKNLYPMLLPVDVVPDEHPDYQLFEDPLHKGRTSYGFHFLQWTSSLHDRDWHNMPFEDALVSFQRLAVLEETLVAQPTDFMSQSRQAKNGKVVSGYVSIIKNYGRTAGATLSHGHQQIAYSNILPQQFYNNLRFRQRMSKSFSQYMIEENPPDLQVKDYGDVVLVVPYFMKRPLDMLLLVKDTGKRFLHQLGPGESEQVVLAMQEAIQAIIALMENMGMTPAYNLTVNNGPGCGLYLEFLTKVQLMGGYEQIGLFVCQSNAAESAAQLREYFASRCW
ncbi:MAG: hypothetical protein CSB48_05760 [Proteobacteria bacterium]|nr:MAG: hypothetical protein CSB48_05760 [Pseudomonadota bacterium]